VQSLARQMLRRHDFDGLTVVTNSLPVASILGGAEGIELHVLGGIFLHRQAILLGPQAIESIAHWKFDRRLSRRRGHRRRGRHQLARHHRALQQNVLRHADRVFYCIDQTKLGRATPHRVTGWAKGLTLVTDARPAALEAAGIALPARQLIAAR
jgi:DeoR/GlpR family transcriptional regulator of sugar metabolism